jgi:hypothetical protein
MTIVEEFRKAVVQGDYASAQKLLASLPQAPATIEEVDEIRSLLAWAVPMVRIQRAHDAARFAELIRSAAYWPCNPEGCSTWTFDA